MGSDTRVEPTGYIFQLPGKLDDKWFYSHGKYPALDRELPWTVKPVYAESNARVEARLREALDSIAHAVGMLSKHIEKFHDFDYAPHEVPLELADLRGIQHHLLGSLIDENGNALSSVGDEERFKHFAPDGGKAPIRSDAPNHLTINTSAELAIAVGDEATKSEGRTDEAKARADAVASGSASHENHGSQIQTGVGSERSSPSDPTAERREIVARIIENELSALDLGCGEEVNIRDCIAHFRKEKSLENANDLIGDFSAWCADAILAALDGGKP